MSAFPHYFKALPPGCKHVDVYRVLSLFEVTDPALQHAAKKLLCAGARGAKDQGQDIAEAIATLQRWQQMRAEEATPVTDFNLYTSAQPAAAPEDAERGAYLARWKDAPEWAEWLSQDASGRCDWWVKKPVLSHHHSEWLHGGVEAGRDRMAKKHNLLGSVRCEPRPRQGEGS